MRHICVFCGSSTGGNSAYKDAAVELGRLLAERDITLVYGGGNIGLMGEIARSVIRRNGRAIGVIPQFLVEKELVYRNLTEVKIVDTMHARKALMAKMADAFIAMPGGYGTLEETVEVLTWVQLGLLDKPVGLLNIDGYYSHLNLFFDHMVAEGFLLRDYKDMLLMQAEPSAMLESLLAFDLPVRDKRGNLNRS
jgi:uncharacterized protein (TIGR00730 family)